MDTLLSIIIALSFGGAATLAIWLLVEASDAVLRKKRGNNEDGGFGGFGYQTPKNKRKNQNGGRNAHLQDLRRNQADGDGV
ncbi:TPA: hypothetical protein ACFRHF_001811 [Neisseria lactamica]